MRQAKQYRVFGATINNSVTGGKRVAVLEIPSDADFGAIARETGVPLTAFITAKDADSVNVRYFNKDGSEKPESDSAALVVAHHLGGVRRVVAPGGTLEVTRDEDLYWTAQGEHHVLPPQRSEDEWLAALNVSQTQRERDLEVLCAGSPEKHNVIVPVWEDALNRLKPDWDMLAELLEGSGVNGAILAAFGANRSHVNFRFFAPHRGLKEDNAGSYSLATLCGYLAPLAVNGTYNLGASQGFATGKPSSLRAKYTVRNATALMVRVGGAVVEVV
jgi:predicted PhzF superfamily epimerase YddE/YHI9